MAVCSAATLLADASTNRFTGVEPIRWNPLVLQLLYEIATASGMADCSVDDLLSRARSNRFTGVEPIKWNPLVLQLLCEILDATGGGGGSQEIYQGEGNPNDLAIIPDDPTKPALFEDLTNNIGWWWHVDDQSWINPAEGGYFPENFTQGFYYEPTFEDIRLISSQTYNKFAIAQGQLADDDEQGAMFYWAPDSAEADDGIDILEPDDGGLAGFGRWKRY